MLHCRNHSLALLVVFTLTACAGPVSEADTTAADASTIRDMVQEWIGYYNASDVQGLSSLYMSEAIGMHPAGPNNVGQDAIRRDFEEGFEQFDGTQSATADEVRVEGDLAYVLGSWMVTGGTSPDVDGEWLWVLNRQQDGRWRIARHISNQSIPAP